MKDHEITFTFEKGGNPDPFQLVLELGLSFSVDCIKKTIRTAIQRCDQDAVRTAVERHGYTFVSMMRDPGD